MGMAPIPTSINMTPAEDGADAYKPDIKSLSRDQLITWLVDHGERAFRADQILKWLYVRLADQFDQMTDIHKDFRKHLSDHFRIARLEARTLDSSDGTRKFLFALEDGRTIESVLIPERDHSTLCVSSQVGCALGCRFCLTGQGGLERNLTAAEIVGQAWEVRKRMAAPERLTNLVFMGMGEPLANYAAVVAAINTLSNSDWGMKFAGRRITVSTSGLAPRIPDLGRDTRANLAVSLNAVDDETRSRLMPINNTFPLAALLAACRQFPLAPGRKITFEYILIRDLNDSLDHARRLTKLLAPIRAKINLIPFNEHPGSAFRRPSAERIQAFQDFLIGKHFTSIVRYSKGQDIMAACGQLRSAIDSIS
jgi:23S rRNA (adenine2503-C2)-methyltransferase